MYKATSDNAVQRDRSRVINDRSNHTLSDFEKRSNDLSFEKAELIAEIRDHEAFFARVKRDKRHHERMVANSRSRTNVNVMMKWEQEILRRRDRVRSIELRLRQIKVEHHALNCEHGQYSKMTYTDAFYRCAKELLPHEIMSRIDSATIALLAHVNDGPRTLCAQQHEPSTATKQNETRTIAPAAPNLGER